VATAVVLLGASVQVLVEDGVYSSGLLELGDGSPTAVESKRIPGGPR